MARRPTLPLAFATGALVLAAGCGGGSNVPADVSDAVITMVRTACFGSCPDYKLTIRTDGSVTFEGRRFVAVEGFQTAQVEPEGVAALIEQFYTIDFPSLADSYECPITDLPTTVTTLSIGDTSKTVRDYGNGTGDESCAAPAALVDLEERIDDVAGTARWVEGP